MGGGNKQLGGKGRSYGLNIQMYLLRKYMHRVPPQGRQDRPSVSTAFLCVYASSRSACFCSLCLLNASSSLAIVVYSPNNAVGAYLFQDSSRDEKGGRWCFRKQRCRRETRRGRKYPRFPLSCLRVRAKNGTNFIETCSLSPNSNQRHKLEKNTALVTRGLRPHVVEVKYIFSILTYGRGALQEKNLDARRSWGKKIALEFSKLLN